MDIKPWQIVVLLIVLALVGFAAWIVRAFNQGRRG
jgi:flagellar biogenesis protein FliO